MEVEPGKKIRNCRNKKQQVDVVPGLAVSILLTEINTITVLYQTDHKNKRKSNSLILISVKVLNIGFLLVLSVSAGR